MICDKIPRLVARLFGEGEIWLGCKAGTIGRKSFSEHGKNLMMGRNVTCGWRGSGFCQKGGADMRKLNPKRYKNGDGKHDFMCHHNVKLVNTGVIGKCYSYTSCEY